MSFFIRKRSNPSSNKRKQPNKIRKPSKKLNNKAPESNGLGEDISSDDTDIENYKLGEDAYSSDEETEQEKKLRLTKKYLEQIENEEHDEELPDLTKDAVARRLKDEALEEEGRLEQKRAHEYENETPEVYCILKGHKLSITCIAISSNENFLYSASKDGAIIKWSLADKKKVKVIPGGKKIPDQTFYGHTEHVLAMALSSDDKFLATGCRGKIINIWNPDTMERVHIFQGHKDAITGLAFERGSHQLISASSDRSLKLWNLDEMGYIETLFGHQDAVTDIDCFVGETALTSGGRDNTVRVWKIVEESQLVFQGHGASIDCVCVSSHQRFVSGGDDGCLSLWGVHKKKSLCKINNAHGSDSETGEKNWIVCVCALRNTDLIASGSKDGCIRLWKRDDEKNSLLPISSIPVKGFVNTLQFSLSGKYLVAGIGQEHRLGRWWRIKEAQNSIVIYSWPNKS